MLYVDLEKSFYRFAKSFLFLEILAMQIHILTLIRLHPHHLPEITKTLNYYLYREIRNILKQHTATNYTFFYKKEIRIFRDLFFCWVFL